MSISWKLAGDPRIIHRDIKSSNILLDHNFEAKVLSTRACFKWKADRKADVFSFGVMLLELLTGKKPNDPIFNNTEDSLVEWAGPLLVDTLENRNYNELVNPRLEGNYETNEVARMVSSAAASIRHAAKRCPKMSQIVRALEGCNIRCLERCLETTTS